MFDLPTVSCGIQILVRLEFNHFVVSCAAKSKIFETLFAYDPNGTSQDVVNMEDFDSESVQEFLNFLYLNRVHDLEKIARSLLPIAFKVSITLPSWINSGVEGLP